MSTSHGYNNKPATSDPRQPTLPVPRRGCVSGGRSGITPKIESRRKQEGRQRPLTNWPVCLSHLGTPDLRVISVSRAIACPVNYYKVLTTSGPLNENKYHPTQLGLNSLKFMLFIIRKILDCFSNKLVN